MKKIAALFCLVIALLACAMPSLHADSPVPIQPNGPCNVATWTINNNPLQTFEYAYITEVDFTDGSVQYLDPYNGDIYTIDFATDGSTCFVTAWTGNPGASPIDSQWVVTAD